MLVAFSTVRRGAPLDDSGEVVLLDWESQQVVARASIGPTGITHDPNPRGNTRGARGIELLDDDHLVVASFNALHVFDRALRKQDELHHPLMVGLHEIELADDGHLWLAATNIEAAVCFDPVNREVTETLWPRSHPALQARFGLTPLDVDPERLDVTRFIADGGKHPSHVHLNAVTTRAGSVLGLLNRQGAVVDLRSGSVVVQDPHLRGAHNLSAGEPGRITINDTRGRAVRTFDQASGTEVHVLDLMSDPWASRIAHRHDWRYRLRTQLRRLGLPTPPWQALFVRGLESVGDCVLVGVSPASVLQIGLDTGTVVRRFTLSDDVRWCVHGLRVVAI